MTQTDTWNFPTMYRSPKRKFEDLTPSDVTDAETFLAYAREAVGFPAPYPKDKNAAAAAVRELFEEYPGMTWRQMCGLVTWARAKKKRPPTAMALVKNFRYAWADGFIGDIQRPEGDEVVEKGIARALDVETDPYWREKLAMSVGAGRKAVYEQWLAKES